MKHTGWIVVLWWLGLAACEEPRMPEVQDLDFFPLHVGFYQIYDVEEHLFPFGGNPSVAHYQIKTHVADKFINESGGETYILYRYTRLSPMEDWTPVATWSARKTNRMVIQTEDNLPLVKLGFPVRRGSQWDGNAWNPLPEEIYRVDSLNKPFTYQNQIFFRTATVLQENNEDYIVQQERRIEKYAPEAGMIYREDILLNYCTQPACLGQEIIQSGRKIWYRITTYGTE
jgi:hypothetical protein